MATTFKTLRRYEKVGLIILGVIVMIFFTIDPSILTGNRGGTPEGQLKGATLVTWNGGALTYGQFEQIARDHRSVIEVETEIIRQISRDVKNPATPKVQPIMQATGDEDLINRYIFASYASSIGIQVDDDTVRNFLRKLSDDRLNMADIKAILDDIVGDTPDARTRFFAAVRRELAAKAVERMIFASQAGVAPETMWEQFRQVRQRAQVQFLELPVKNYLDQVKDAPSDAELKTLYEELKNEYRQTEIPDSGVKRPEELAFQWVRADFETFLKAEMKNVTDEQVAEYYEKNKANYKLPSKPPVRPTTEETTEGDPTKEPQSEPEAPKPEGEPAEKPAAEPANPPADPAAEKPGDPPPADPPGQAAPEEPASGEPKPEDPPASEEDPELVSFVAGGAAGQDPAQENPAQDKPAEEKPAQEKPAQEQPSQEKPAEEKPAQESPTPEQPAQEKPEGDAAQEKPAETPPSDEYRPLSEVADQIRRDLASPAADKQYTAALKNAEEELREFWKKVNLGDGKIDENVVQGFDLEAFAAKHNLTSGVIPLSPIDVAVTYPDLGKFPGFVQQAYLRDQSLRYEPRTITNFFGFSTETYIYWRTDEKEEFTPTFEECRDDLIKAARYRKAKELAKKDAQEKAAAVKVGSSLKETFPKENVLVTGQFSQAEGRILEIPGADPAFLSEVFKIKPLTAASVGLADQSKFYVVYLSQLEFSNEELKSEFEKYPKASELLQAADAEATETRRAVYTEFLTALNRQFPGQANAEEGQPQ